MNKKNKNKKQTHTSKILKKCFRRSWALKKMFYFILTICFCRLKEGESDWLLCTRTLVATLYTTAWAVCAIFKVRLHPKQEAPLL